MVIDLNRSFLSVQCIPRQPINFQPWQWFRTIIGLIHCTAVTENSVTASAGQKKMYVWMVLVIQSQQDCCIPLKSALQQVHSRLMQSLSCFSVWTRNTVEKPCGWWMTKRPWRFVCWKTVPEISSGEARMTRFSAILLPSATTSTTAAQCFQGIEQCCEINPFWYGQYSVSLQNAFANLIIAAWYSEVSRHCANALANAVCQLPALFALNIVLDLDAHGMYLLQFGRYIINKVRNNSKRCGQSYQFVIILASKSIFIIIR